MGTLRQYLAEVEINKETFNIQQWWRLREQVDEGAWSLNERAVTFATTYKIYALPDGKTTLFSYETDRIRATESVIHKDQTKSYLENITGIKASIHTDNLIIDTFNNGDKRVVYVGEIDEMKEVVGFFDYTGEEMELLEGLVWLSETWLQTET